MTEIYDFWNALWHDSWASWEGLWLFQTTQRPIDRALGGVVDPTPKKSRRQPAVSPAPVVGAATVSRI